MYAFTKHPSTHVFFHVDKSAAQQATSPPSGGGGGNVARRPVMSHKTQLQHSRLPADASLLHSHGYHALHSGQIHQVATGSIASSIKAPQQHHHRPVSTILTGGQSPPSQWDDFDLFCQSPYILSAPPGPHQHPFVPPHNLHGHPLNPQIQESSLDGDPLNAGSAIPSSYGSRLAGGQAAALRLQRGGSSEDDKPRLRSNSYYSIPVVEHGGTLTKTHDYHWAPAVPAEPESCLPNRRMRLEQTKGGRSGKCQEWELQGLGPPPQGSVPMGGARRPQDIREPLGPANRGSAYQYKGAHESLNTKQRGAENLEGTNRQLAQPVDALTVSARMIHRILPSEVAQLKSGQFTNMCGIAISSINVVERDTCVVMDMCESAGFMARDLPSPATELLSLPRDWISVQLARHQHTFGWLKKQSGKSHPTPQGHAAKGLLLMNVERNSQFPFMTYMTCREPECARLMREIDDLHISSGQGGFGGLGGYCVNCSSNTELSMTAQQTRIHHTGAYIEVASIARRKGGDPNPGAGGRDGGIYADPLMGFGGDRGEPRMTERRTDGAYSALEDDQLASSTGYIISFFRVFPGEDSERLDRSWPLWTGARQIHRRLPKCVDLNRISFHKKVDPHNSGITYVLLCECPRIMDYLTEACVLVDQLRARCCGYTALYRVVDSF